MAETGIQSPAPRATSTSVPRYDGIQGLRFVAALLVVVTHSTWYATQRLDSSGDYFWFGAVGVDVFFVISGFVMMVSSRRFQRDAHGAARFGYRRLIRVVPMYWLATTVKVLTLLVLPAAAINSSLSPNRLLASYVFFPSRAASGETGVLLGVGWTLVFEMMFYLLFTLGLAFHLRPELFSGGVLLAFALLSMLRPAEDWPIWQYWFNPVVLYFVIGMAFGRVVMSDRWRRDAWKLALGLVMATFVVGLLPGGFGWGSHSPFRMICVSALVMCVIAAESQLRPVLRAPILYMGDASYSLYLFHPLVAPVVPVALAKIGLINNTVAAVASVTASLVAAALVYRYVEQPATRVLRRHEPSALHR